MSSFKFGPVRSRWALALIAAASTTAAPAVLYAQTPPEQAVADPLLTEPGDTEVVVTISDMKVNQFADAYVAVQEIQVKTAEQLDTAKDPEQADAVRAAAETEMVHAVERSGLQLEEFNQIAQLMASDLELRNRVVEKVQSKRRS